MAGYQPVDAPTPGVAVARTQSPHLEIVCDESGYEGEKLIGGTTAVFAHGSVRIEAAAADAVMAELRDRIRSPATEYKANHLLRSKHRDVLVWLLSPDGPLLGRGRVYLIDKAYFAVVRVLALLAPHADPATLYREGRRRDRALWQAFLAASNDLLRVTDRLDGAASVDSFLGTVEALRSAGVAGEILDALGQARADVAAARERLRDDPPDPLLPAIVSAVAHWGNGSGPISIVHDRQRTLSAARIAQLARLAPGQLAGLSFAASHADSRVQVADILAGTARKIAEEELNGRGDAELSRLLRPYVDPHSIWGDDRSWSLLAPAAEHTDPR